MANLRDIKRRIKSVRNTSQITKAMQMVASAKMRRAQELALNGRAYISALANVLRHMEQSDIREGGGALMAEVSSGRDLVIVINTDKGLCGALNANLLREVITKAPKDAAYFCIGGKLEPTLERMGRHVEYKYSVGDDFTDMELKIRAIMQTIYRGRVAGEYNHVSIFYQKFVNVMTQRPQVRKLLPITFEELLTIAAQDDVEDTAGTDFVLEPSPRALLVSILPLYVGSVLAQLILEGKASEQSARMVAMKAATENANDLIGELTLDYNKARQTQITNELLEITTATRAME